MEVEKRTSVSRPVVRSGYDFSFEYNNLIFRVGGSSTTGSEYVYVDDVLISSAKKRSELSVHEFEVSGIAYRVEFQVLDRAKASLACRLYCEGKLVKLFGAIPKRLIFTRPLFAAGVLLALFINDGIVNWFPLSYVLGFLALVAVIDVVYPMRHIRIMELEV